MSILTHGLRRYGRKALEITLPNSCFLCGSDSLALLCQHCIADLPILTSRRCPYCAQPTPRGDPCGTCLARPFHFDGTTALFHYDFPVDRLIHAFKYGGQLSLGSWLGELLADTLIRHSFDRIIPLPLYPARLAERGFNQSGEIAGVISQRMDIPLDLKSCRRIRPTAHQAELPLTERGANVRGVFECTADISGQRILLVDDVMTSGATLNECARVLKLHGACQVETAVIARALRD